MLATDNVRVSASRRSRGRTHPRTRKTVALLAALGASCSGLVVGMPGAAGAIGEVCQNFTATAASDAVRTGLSSPGVMTVENADVSAPAAQAYVDALGQSRALGAAPYPGETVLSLAALAGAPAYPLAAQSQYPTRKEAAVDSPAARLSATSGALESAGSAQLGPSAADGVATVAQSTALADAGCSEDNGVTEASAETSTKGVSVADGTLEIGVLQSEARAVRSAGGKPKLTSSLEAVDITVAGRQVALTDKGLEAAGNGTALPGNPALAPLKEAGISVTYIDAVRDPDGNGITSPGLQISLTREVTGTGPTEISYTIGRSYARVAGSDEASSFAAPSGSLGLEAPISSDGAPTDSGGTSSAPSTMAGTAPSAAADAPSATTPPPAATAPAGSESMQPVSFAPPDFSAAGLYLGVMGGGAALLISGLIVRIFGVKLGWT